MNKMMSVFCLLLLMTITAGVNSQVTGSLTYLNFDDDADFDAVAGSVGYRFEELDNFFLIPELRGGLGVGSERIPSITIEEVTLELDRFIGVGNRAQYEFGNGVYLFAAVSYINYRFKEQITPLEGAPTSRTDSSWEWGVGGGLGFQLTDMLGAEGSWERVDGADLFTAGLRIRF